MGNSESTFGAASFLEMAVEVKGGPHRRTREEEMEMLRQPQKMLRTGSVTRSLQRHLGQPKTDKIFPPLRKTKSLDFIWEPQDDLWESIDGGLGDKDSIRDSIRPRIPNPTMLQDDDDDDDDAASTTTASSVGICDACAGITIEAITSDTGYWHLPVSEISEFDCEMCKTFMSHLGLNPHKQYPDDRYRILFTLELHPKDADVSRSHR